MSNARATRRRTAKLAAGYLTNPVTEAEIAGGICAVCRKPMGEHPKPNYWPCPGPLVYKIPHAEAMA